MLKVLIADDHAIVRKGLREILREASEATLVDEASNGHGSQTQGSEGQPNEVAAPPLVPSQDGQS